jgi:hypothetical protein
MEPWYATAAEPSICYPPLPRGPFSGDQGDHIISDAVVNRRNLLI